MSETLLSPLAADFTLFGGRDAVLLVHGFTGSPSHMLPLGRALQEAGFTVRGIRLKGHGTCIEDMMAASWEDWLSETREAYDDLSAAFRTVSVAGLSMGGVLSLILSGEKNPACCVSLSAPMGIRNPFSFAAPVLGKILPVLHKRRKESAVSLNQDYDIGYQDIPTARVSDLNHLIHLAKTMLPSVRCPLLCAQARQDPSITADSADLILKNAASPVKEKMTLDQPHHLITIGPETDRLYPGICAFITKSVKETE